jgi:hypothetical protein
VATIKATDGASVIEQGCCRSLLIKEHILTGEAGGRWCGCGAGGPSAAADRQCPCCLAATSPQCCRISISLFGPNETIQITGSGPCRIGKHQAIPNSFLYNKLNQIINTLGP